MKIHGSSNLWDATLLYSRVASHRLELLAAVKVLPNTITMVKLINRSAFTKAMLAFMVYGWFLWLVALICKKLLYYIAK